MEFNTAKVLVIVSRIADFQGNKIVVIIIVFIADDDGDGGGAKRIQ